MTVLEQIKQYKIITIIRGLTTPQAISVARAMQCGGLHLVEVTFDQTRPLSETAQTISALCKALGNDMLVGAGTVMTREQLSAAQDAGASFIISPNCDSDIIRETKRLGLVSIPGAFTATEAAVCHAAGADIVKIFPADSVGPAYFKALRGPLRHIAFAAVGGVDLTNIRSFFNAGVCCVGIGANIVNKQAVNGDDYATIQALAGQYAQNVLDLKL